tara:strand:+ start:439 stop:567 length:129 start_codon:yes stop_codon:yes gene_type:complete
VNKNNVIKFPETAPVDKQFIELEKQQEQIREQEERIKKLLEK